MRAIFSSILSSQRKIQEKENDPFQTVTKQQQQQQQQQSHIAIFAGQFKGRRVHAVEEVDPVQAENGMALQSTKFYRDCTKKLERCRVFN
jgi:hypothetical protein